MAGRKLKPIEGDVCWFCKQPADAGSWLDLGELKSTHEPVFEGTHYILYHEPCAVYSNGAIVSVTGMDDQAVLQFWLHGERCSGIGLKCQLCGLRGATTGCLHGPCQQFYHYPCARVRAFQGYLQFSPTCRALACDKHLALLPDPGEQEFLGMWMEGAGGWKGLYKEQAAAAWQTRYTAHITDFKKRWHHLLSMVPLEERKAMQQKQKKRRSSKAGMASAEAGDSDPEFRVRKQSRTSHPGAKAKTGQQQQRQRQRQQQTVKQGASSPRALQQRVPQRVGVPPEVAQAALHAAVQQQQAVPNAGAGAAGDRLESGAVGDEKSSELLSLDGANGQQQAEQQYQAAAGPLHRVSSGGHSHAELLLRAAGFTTSPSPTAHQQQDHSHGLLPSHSDAFAPASSSDRPAHAAAAALAAAVMAAAAKNGSSSRTASSVAKAAAAGAAAGLGSGASSADSAPAHKETNRAAVAEAPAGDTDPTADAGQEVISAVASFPVRRTAPYCRQAVEAAAAAARSAAPSGRTAPAAAGDGDGGAGLKDQSDNSMPGFNAGCCREQPGAEAGGAATGAAASSRGGNRRQRRYLDVNTYAAMGQKKLTFEPELDAASQQRRQAAATVGKHQQQQISRLPSSSTTAPAASPSVAAANLLGWPGNRGVDMFSWLQQQVQPQPLASPPPVHTSAGLTDTHLPGGQPPPNANGLTALGLVTQRRAAAIAGGNGGQLTVSTEVLQQAADAVADAATKLRSRLESGDKHKVLADMEGLKWQATAAAARESSTQVPYMAKQSPLTTPRLPLGTSATAADSSDNNNLVPAVAKLLRVIGAQVGGQQQPPPAGPAGLDSTQQQKSTLKQSRSLDPYMGVEVANAAAAAAAGASCNVLSSPSAAATLGSLAGPFELLPHMAEYFGCVSALPALQPGELRAGGVTAHPKVVSAYVKQDMRKALTLQPWSIVIPPFALRQLRSAQIEPGHLASQLYQLLHASNVLNHHSTNATAAGGGRGAGGGSLGVSGGYAGMPQDFPVRFVQGCMIPGDDPRPELRGEFMLKAMQDIEVGTIIGPWRCYLLAQEDYSRLQRTVPADWQGPDAGVRAQAWLQLLHKYTLSVRVPFLATNDPYGKALASNAPVLHLCALGYGHLTCLVNDAIKDPMSAAAGLETINTAAPNVELCVVLVNGLPLPVLISTRQIKQGQELLCSYGKNYWQTWCSLREETATVSHGGSGQQQHMQHV